MTSWLPSVSRESRAYFGALFNITSPAINPPPEGWDSSDFRRREDPYSVLTGSMPDIRDEMRARLRKDHLCTKCLSHCESDNESDNQTPISRGCKFTAIKQDRYCAGCEKSHPIRAFSFSELQKPSREAVCIGRTGTLKICEHKSVSWADIEAHTTRPFSERSRSMPLSDLEISCDTCKDAAHNACWGSKASYLSKPTSMILRPGGRNSSGYLSIVCTRHEILDVNGQGQLDASAVRSMFMRHRQAGSLLFAVPESLTEMRCFGHPDCTCIRYETSW